MKQIFQNISNGESYIEDIPLPIVKKGEILISTSYSVISPGTEKSLIKFSKSSFISKAIQQPDKVKEVFDKAKNDGPLTAIEAIKNRLNMPLELGYCNVGIVEDVGEGVLKFKKGDRVISNGPHSEYCCVPQNLCAKVPSNVSSEEASFTVLASIGLQAIRLAKPSFGETFVVTGLGIIGLLTIQLLKANGCKVIGIDINSERCKLANQFGIESINLSEIDNPVEYVNNLTEGRGVDGVLISATTNSDEPIHMACKLCRKRGRIVLIGVTGLNFRRDLLYKKELTFQVSCSYGPGRYDSFYEEKGNDYPIGFVRWTENRNFQAILSAFSQKSLNIYPLISKRLPFEKVLEGYELLNSNPDILGILLEYKIDKKDKNKSKELIHSNLRIKSSEKLTVSVIGSGNHASRSLLPNLSNYGALFDNFLGNKGEPLVRLGNKFKFSKVTTDKNIFFKNNKSNLIVIASRHDTHALFIKEALKSNKNIFVEKPLCLTTKDLIEIKKLTSNNLLLMVGYNRRFSPLIKKLKNIIDEFKSPKCFIYTCNSGYLDKSHWTQDIEIGGGRLLGEACHFVDLLRFLAGTSIVHISKIEVENTNIISDTFSISIKFEDGSIGTINYFSNGHRSFPKENLKVFVEGKIIELDNYRKLKTWGVKGFQNIRKFSQDKGHKNCIKAFLDAIKNGQNSPIPLEEIFEVQEKLLGLVGK